MVGGATHCVGCCRSCGVLRTVGVLPHVWALHAHAHAVCYALWCCYRSWWVVLRTVAAATAAGVVLPHTGRATARTVCASAHVAFRCYRSSSLLLSLSLLSPPAPALRAVGCEERARESREQDPNPPLRCAEPGAWPLCSVVVLALTDRARVNRYTDITGIPRIRRAESQGRGACCGVRRLRFASAACHLRIPLALPSFLLLLFPMPLALHHHTT